MENLIRAGQNALDTLETARLQRGVDQKLDQDTRSQYIATDSSLDAEQGILVAKTARGDFYAESITNRALDGGSVSQPIGATIGKIDEKPVFEPSDSLIDGNGVGDGVNDGSGTGSGGAGDPTTGGGDGTGDGVDCSQQVVWYRGTPYEDPTEGDPPMAGQCEVLYSVRWAWAFSQSNFLRGITDSYAEGYPPFSIEAVNGGQPDSDGNTIVFPKARLKYRELVGGVLVDTATPFQFFGFANANGAAIAGWIRFCIGSGDPPDESKAKDSTGFGSLPANATAGAGDGSGNKCFITAPDDNCGMTPPAYGPPNDRPPTEWAGVCIPTPPARVDADTNGDRTLLTIWDQATSQASPLTQLDFQPGAFEFQTLCKGEGPPAS